MSAYRVFVVRHSFPIFIFLAYALSWWWAPLAQGGMLPHGPALAAVIVVALAEGRPGLQAFWRRCTNWRAGWWYLVGPTIIVAYLFAAFAINLLLGAKVANLPVAPSAAVLLNLLLLGGLWEEPGWTGYALPTLQERLAGRAYANLIATLVTGIFRGLWHLPLVVYGVIPWYDALFFVLALQVIIAWIYNKSGGSVPAVMVTHFMSNTLTGYTMLLVFSGSEKTMYYILFVVCACLAALAILLRSQLKLGDESRRSFITQSS